MPRLKCSFREFIDILEQHGFVLHRQASSSHRIYRGTVNGEVRLVTVAPHSLGAEVLPDTLNSMIRQSGLPKKLFRK